MSISIHARWVGSQDSSSLRTTNSPALGAGTGLSRSSKQSSVSGPSGRFTRIHWRFFSVIVRTSRDVVSGFRRFGGGRYAMREEEQTAHATDTDRKRVVE